MSDSYSSTPPPRARQGTTPFDEVLAPPGQAPLDLIDRPGFDTGLARFLHERRMLDLEGLIAALSACRQGSGRTLARALVLGGRLSLEEARLVLREVASRVPVAGPDRAGPDDRTVAYGLEPVRHDARVHSSGEIAGDPWVEGVLVGPYRLLERVGIGGMGLVFRAQHSATGQVVALKTFRLDADPDLKARFHREYEAQRRLDHPNLVPVLDRGAHQGRPWFVMEFASGGDLSQRLREERVLEPRTAARIARDLARGLAHAHDQGVLHRDIKPANVLFDDKGNPKLVDLGIAKLIGAETLTLSGDLLGTPAYMSPEQGLGERALIGPRSDVYSLGVLLYRMLTGCVPFSAEGAMDLIALVATAEPVDPRELAEHVPDELAELCSQLLAKDPEARMSARELEAALGRFLHGETPEPETGPQPKVSTSQRNVYALLVFALFAGGVGLGWWGQRGEPDPVAPPAVADAAPEPPPTAPEAAPVPDRSYPLALAPGELGLYRLALSSESEFALWQDQVTDMELELSFDLRLRTVELEGRTARIAATLEELTVRWELEGALVGDAPGFEPMRFDSLREPDPEHPFLRAQGQSFSFCVDQLTGEVTQVEGTREIQARILEGLDLLAARRHRISLLDEPGLMRALLGQLWAVMPSALQPPPKWTFERPRLAFLAAGGQRRDLTAGPSLATPDVELTCVPQPTLDEDELLLNYEGEAERRKQAQRWSPVGLEENRELEFDLVSRTQQSGALRYRAGRPLDLTLEQLWEQERVYRVVEAPQIGGRARSFGRDRFSLRRIGD
ncbi:MAG: serine/threonine-protein kinase [Planctomycetota bacterium]